MSISVFILHPFLGLWKQIPKLIGITHSIKLLSQLKVTLLIHVCLFILLHIIASFFMSILPFLLRLVLISFLNQSGLLLYKIIRTLYIPLHLLLFQRNCLFLARVPVLNGTFLLRRTEQGWLLFPFFTCGVWQIFVNFIFVIIFCFQILLNLLTLLFSKELARCFRDVPWIVQWTVFILLQRSYLWLFWIHVHVIL